LRFHRSILHALRAQPIEVAETKNAGNTNALEFNWPAAWPADHCVSAGKRVSFIIVFGSWEVFE